MLGNYGVVFLFLALAFGFVLISLIAGAIIRPKHPDDDKNSTYECGERPVGTAWINFNIRFYIIALIFLLFDVEVVFIFPVAIVYRDWLAHNTGLFALIELIVFIVILFFALIYAWGKGDLNWIKTVKRYEEV